MPGPQSPITKGLTRRSLILGTTAALGGLSGLVRTRRANAAELPGRIIGLTTLDSDGASGKSSAMLSLELGSGHSSITALGDYKEGHNLTPLPNGEFFAVPYGDEEDPCLFLDARFNVISKVYAPRRHGFGGHAVLLPDNRTLFTHFNRMGRRQGRAATDTGRYCLIDITTREVTESVNSTVIHGHDIMLTRDRQTLILADDGTIETPVDANSPFSDISWKPALYLFDTQNLTLEPSRVIDLPINGSLVHIEEGPDGRIFGGTEKFVWRNDRGMAELRKLLGDQTEAFVASLPQEAFPDDLPFPGPLIGVDPHTGASTMSVDARNLDPFDIRHNSETGLLFSVFISSNQLARYDSASDSWRYHPTHDWQIDKPYGLIEIPGTPLMIINGFNRGVAVFDARTMALVSHADIPTMGMKHMVYVG